MVAITGIKALNDAWQIPYLLAILGQKRGADHLAFIGKEGIF